MALVNANKLRFHILLELKDQKPHGKETIKKKLGQYFGLTYSQVIMTEGVKVKRNAWDRQIVRELSWLRRRGLINNQIINGKPVEARVKITILGKEILGLFIGMK